MKIITLNARGLGDYMKRMGLFEVKRPLTLKAAVKMLLEVERPFQDLELILASSIFP